jgi:hypothetical protein
MVFGLSGQSSLKLPCGPSGQLQLGLSGLMQLKRIRHRAPILERIPARVHHQIVMGHHMKAKTTRQKPV